MGSPTGAAMFAVEVKLAAGSAALAVLCPDRLEPCLELLRGPMRIAEAGCSAFATGNPIGLSRTTTFRTPAPYLGFRFFGYSEFRV